MRFLSLSFLLEGLLAAFPGRTSSNIYLLALRPWDLFIYLSLKMQQQYYYPDVPAVITTTNNILLLCSSSKASQRREKYYLRVF